VWTPLASPPEIVRVSVLPRGEGARPEARARKFQMERRAFDDAIAGSAGAMPPGNPAKLTSLVRKVRFDPPVREGASAPVEIEDYVMGYFAEISARTLADALTHVWLLRSSRRPAR
jgi:ATP-dependent Clp protease ATP-binding subunit ClpC